MSITKKILLILTPIIAVFVLLVVFVVNSLKEVESKIEQIEQKVQENKKNDGIDLEIDKNSRIVYGNKKVTQTNRKIADFDKIVLKGAYKVGLLESDTIGLVVETDENLHESIKTKVVDGTLEISIVDNIKESEKLDVYISYKHLSSIEVNGAVLITNKDVLVGDKLSIELKGAGSLDLELNVKDLNIIMAGGTHAQLTGKSKKSKFEIKGVGVLSAYKLISDTTSVHVAGAGTARVYANDYLDAMISGAGSIKYMGNPEVKKKIAGFGKISQEK